MKQNTRTRLIERAVRGSARKDAIEYYAYVVTPCRDRLWLKGELSPRAALDAWRRKHPEADAAAGAGQEIRLVSGMTVVDGRSRPRRLWSVVPADSGVGALCTGREVVEGEARWDPGKDVPFYPESRKHVLKIFRARFSRVVSLLEKRGLELCAREIAAVLDSGEELSRLGWKEDWILKAMRRWADGAARWEARRQATAGGPQPSK